MKVIYVAGKYRSDTEWGLIENIRHAEKAAVKLWREGWAVICPHKNTAHFGGVFSNSEDDHSKWIDGDLEMLKRCDAIYMLKGWEKSQGANQEFNLAQALHKEIMFEE